MTTIKKRQKREAGRPETKSKKFRRLLTPAKIEVLISAFRDHPGNYSHAARCADVSTDAARRAWELGVQRENLPPIREIIGREQEEARILAEKEKRGEQLFEAESELYGERAAKARETERALRKDVEARDKARADAIAARKAEADLVRANRGNTIALVSVTGRALRGAIQNANKLERLIAEGKNPNGKELSVMEQVNLLDRLARTVERASRAARDTMAMERILLGEPTEILGITTMDQVSEEDAIREIEASAEAARRARARMETRESRLRLIQGGSMQKADSK